MSWIKNGLITLLALIGVLIAVFWIPWPAVIHGLILLIYIKWLSVIVLVGLSVFIFRLFPVDKDDLADAFISWAIFALAPALTVSLITGIWSNYSLASTLHVQTIERPDTAAASWIPKAVASSYVNKHYNATSSHPGPIDPWIEPSGSINWIFADTSNFIFGLRSPRGLTTVTPGEQVNNLTLETVQDVSQIDVRPVLGESEIIWPKSYQFWTLVHGNLLSRYPDIYYAQSADGGWYAIQPLITYIPCFPQPIPSQGKVVVYEVTTGKYEKLSVKKAHSMFPNQWLLSKELAAKYVQVLQNRDGLINAWFTHTDQVIPGDLEGILHPVKIKDTYFPTWYYSLEPYGRAKGQVGYAYVETIHGTILIDTLSKSDRMNATGFGSIVGATQSVLTKDYNWVHDYRVSSGESSKSVTSGNSLLLEPRPISTQGRLLALMTITGRGADNVSEAVLADVVTKEVMILNDEHQFEQVLTGDLPFVAYIPGKMVYNVINCDNLDSSHSLSGVSSMTTDDLWQQAQAILSELKSRN